MINIIVAIAENGVIGGKNRLLWHISEDLKSFKRVTTGHPVIMGRKTYESLGRPLPNRKNVVITRQDIEIEGCSVVHSLHQALRMFTAEEEIFIIGGAEIYREALPLAHKLYITRVHHPYQGDTLFPDYDTSTWELDSSVHIERGESYEHPFTFEEWRTTKWSIRNATTEDIPLIHSLAEDSFVDTYKDVVSTKQLEYMMDMMYSHESLAQQFEEGHRYYIMSDISGCVIGYGSISPEGEMLYHLEKLYLIPTAKGQGYGAILFAHLLGQIKRLCGGGDCRVELNVHRKNPTVEFYFRQGMKIAQSEDFKIEGTDFVKPDYILYKEL